MSEPSLSSITIYQLRVVLCGVSPLAWRRLLVASDTTIAELQEILQSAFDWSGEHLHRFLIHGAAYGIRCLGGIVFEEVARRVPLSRFGLHCGERIRYEYDFTADWTLEIRLEKTLPLVKIACEHALWLAEKDAAECVHVISIHTIFMDARARTGARDGKPARTRAQEERLMEDFLASLPKCQVQVDWNIVDASVAALLRLLKLLRVTD